MLSKSIMTLAVALLLNLYVSESTHHFVQAQQDFEEPEQELVKQRPTFNWSDSNFMESQLKLEGGVPTNFCKDKNFKIIEIHKVPFATNTACAPCLKVHFPKAIEWLE